VSATILFFGLIFGAIGGLYAIYGKRSDSTPHLVCGVLLMLYPYFVPSVILTLLIGIVLTLIPVGLARGWF
jgi:predicted membrane protein